MTTPTKGFSQAGFLIKIALPAFAGTIALLATVFLTLDWSTRAIDAGSEARQVSLVRLVVDKLRAQIAHDQESTTVWDDAVNTLLAPEPDESWIDSNMGSWMGSYFGHDAVFVLTPDDAVTFAYTGGDVREHSAFAPYREAVMAIVPELRKRLAAGDQTGIDDKVLTIGISDFAMAAGRPAIVSVKPVVSDSGEITQVAGREPLHVSVRFLDGSLLTSLARDYLIDGLAFSAQPAVKGQAGVALTDRHGTTIGHFVWKPYRPGSAFETAIMPAVIIAATLFALLALSVVVILYRRALSQERNRARVEYLAYHDALTGLSNRRSFDRDLDSQLSASAALAVLYLDLDRFKQVNDTLGHAAGDVVIREAGNRISQCLSGRGRLYRIGGDEFMVLADMALISDIDQLCRAIITEICKPVMIEDKVVYIGVSIGVSFAPSDGHDRATLARKADVALYHAKEAGRGRHSTFTPDMDRVVAERARLEHELRQALPDAEAFDIRYVPVASTHDGTVTGLSAELHFRHPERGSMALSDFRALAEDAGLMPDLGLILINRAVAEAAAWSGTTLSIRLSAEQLRQPSFSLHVTAALDRSGFDPTRLEFELTDQALSNEDEVASLNIAAIRRMGVSFALAEFGAGVSAIGRLNERQIDRVKIDRRFVGGLGRTRSDEAVVRAIIAMAEANGLTTVAEGVENSEQQSLLARIGCQIAETGTTDEALDAKAVKTMLDSGKRAAG